MRVLRWMILLFALSSLTFGSATVFAQDGEDAEAAAEDSEGSEESEGDSEELEDEEEEEEEVRESEDGSYEYKRSYGAGFEAGLWFNGLDRWSGQLLRRNEAPEFDIFGLWHFDLYAEASLIENTRLSIFGGYQSPFSSDPSASAFYLGVEPAFAFRRDMWEVAVGAGIAFGATNLGYDSIDAEMDAGLIVVRPFIEVRRYLNEWMGVYGRFGFNQWLVDDPEFTNLEFTVADDQDVPINDDNLNEGGAYVALGVRFGHYPEHIKNIPDTDNDGYKDDVDECPEDPEDFDQFEDEDGCPDPDNDNDGILDGEDKCPNQPEDIDGWQDEDGCPETDDDSDGDGILNKDDACPNEPEDKDGWKDNDGCPDPDNDNDGILDKDDKCPNKPGVPQKDGCPFEKVKVTMEAIEISDKVYFEYDKATIKEESFQLLSDVAETIKAFPRIKLIEIAGHTDTAGSDSYNEKLSQARAESVMKFLIDKGVDAERLQAKGYGESRLLVKPPEGEKETEAGAEKNRRVEFNILEQEEVTKTVREDQVPEDAATIEKDTEGDKESQPREGDQEPEEGNSTEGDAKEGDSE